MARILRIASHRIASHNNALLNTSENKTAFESSNYISIPCGRSFIHSARKGFLHLDKFIIHTKFISNFSKQK